MEFNQTITYCFRLAKDLWKKAIGIVVLFFRGDKCHPNSLNFFAVKGRGDGNFVLQSARGPPFWPNWGFAQQMLWTQAEAHAQVQDDWQAEQWTLPLLCNVVSPGRRRSETLSARSRQPWKPMATSDFPRLLCVGGEQSHAFSDSKGRFPKLMLIYLE